MSSNRFLIAAVLSFLAGTAGAATIEVQMLNKGTAGAMVFEPEFIVAQPGDTIVFKSTDPGHNAQSIDGMLPDGAEPFKSKMGEDFTLVVDQPGVYGVKCTPHYTMGMVALIQVGDAAANLDASKAVVHKGKAKKRFDEIFLQVE